MKSVKQLAIKIGIKFSGLKYKGVEFRYSSFASMDDLISLCEAYYAERLASEPVVAWMNPSAKDTLSLLHWAESSYYSSPLIAKPKEK